MGRQRNQSSAGRRRVSGTCTTNRRSRAAIRDLRDQLYEIVKRHEPMTCRQTFYQAVNRKLIEKSEGEYRRTICRLLLAMRRDGQLPYRWITDGTRYMHKPDTHESLASALQETQEHYRRMVWAEQNVHVEVWTEKRGLVGVLYPVTSRWDVPLYPSAGFASETFLAEAADYITSLDKPTYIYHFGDHDPSGVLIDRQIERGLRRMAPDAEIHFERVAVTREQIEQYDLPTRPTKRKGNTHAKRFKGESVEVDAIEPDELRRLCEECITQHVDQDAYERMLRVEAAERKTLADIQDSLVMGI